VLDLERLDERYIVIGAEGQPDHGDVEDLRELEADLGKGVHALWSDELQSIVAWAFEKSVYEQDDAEAWVTEAMEPKGANLMDIVKVAAAALAENLARSLGLATQPIEAKREGDWYISPARDFPLAGEETSWSWDTAAENAVLGDDDWARFATAHLLVDMNEADEGEDWPATKAAYKLPVAKEIDGELHYVWNGAAAANAALSGARSELEASDDAKESAAATLRTVYEKFDKDPENVSAASFDDTRRQVANAINEAYGERAPSGYVEEPWVLDIGPNRAIVEMPSGEVMAIPYELGEDGVTLGDAAPAEKAWVDESGARITLMAFSSKLQDGTEAEPDEDDGLVWKEIIHPGSWHKMDTGRVVEVTADIIEAAYEAFKNGLPKYVSVPAGSYHPDQVAAEDNRGFVQKLKIVGDKLFGGFKFTNPDTQAAVEDGSIADCSVYLEPDVIHPETGEKFGWALTHVLLTNNPLVQDLEPFGAPIPASASGNVTVDVYVQEEANMPEHGDELTLSAEDQSLLDDIKGLGLSAEEIKAMVAERERVTQKTRDLEITSIVRALEGVEEHDLVTRVENTRHWPVVVAAAESALREQPETLGLDVTDGRTCLDEVILNVVNAIPAEARMAVGGQPTGTKQHDDPTLEAQDTDEIKDAKAKGLSDMLTPRKGSAVGVG